MSTEARILSASSMDTPLVAYDICFWNAAKGNFLRRLDGMNTTVFFSQPLLCQILKNYNKILFVLGNFSNKYKETRVRYLH